MHKLLADTCTAFRKRLGIDYHDAEQFAEAIHACAMLGQVMNEIECNVNVRGAYELREQASEAIDNFARAIGEQIAGAAGPAPSGKRLLIELQGDPRGCAIRLIDERLPRTNWDGSFSITCIWPGDDE